MIGRPRKIDRLKVVLLYKKGESLKDISQQFGSTPGAIEFIILSMKKGGALQRRSRDNQKQGEKHNRAKLTEKQARKIILMRLNGHTYSDIAFTFKIHETTPRDICIGKSWKYLYRQYEGELLEIIKKKNKTL